MAENSSIDAIRHSLAHLLAAAVLELHPDAKRTIGPAIDNGFYYDFEFPQPISDKDLPAIEKKMRELMKTWDSFERIEITQEDASQAFENNPYKLELVDEIVKKNEPITLYYSGPQDSAPSLSELKTENWKLKTGFLDLCRGGHVSSMRDVDPKSFILDRVAGAYWRGDEKNKMLTRIYGLAFSSEQELGSYLAMREEAQKRDHKKLGPELDLFVFSDLVGPGLPLWTPKGTMLRNLLDDFVWQLREKAGYLRVDIPHITKKELYETSGHWAKFKDELFRITTREGHEFAMKPMNCPHHTQIYARKAWSYRELPQRYASTTKCYRDEQTGELSGLSRLRSFSQDDAHVFCRMSQVKDEFLKIWDIINTFYSAFGIELKVRLSLHDPAQMEKYLGDASKWEQAEAVLREIVTSKNIEWFEGLGEAAFYGPKLDFMGKDALGREHQIATIQLDINMPDRFDLNVINEQGEKERIVMIHAAIMGSIERFLSVLIEHTSGAFPVWLAPIQVAVLPISDKVAEYSQKVTEKLNRNGIRYELDDRNESIGKKIRAAEMQKIPYLLVVGEKEASADAVAIRKRGEGDLGQLKLEEFLEKIKEEIAKKS